jgi:hypothetical protein
MIPIKSITTSLIGIIRNAVGADLSMIDIGGTLYPAVIKDRQSGSMPQYPYIVIDFLTEADVDGWLTGSGVDGNDNVEYTTDKLLFFRFTCYGKNGHEIMSKLKSKLRFDSPRDQLRFETGAAFTEESAVQEQPQLKSVDYIDNGFMDVTLSYVDTEADTASTIIEVIEVNGTVDDVLGNTINTINVNVP